MSIPDFIPDNQVHFGTGVAVYDVADPTMRGVIRAAGPEQSEVKFEGERTRIIQNQYLRVVGAEAEVGGAVADNGTDIAIVGQSTDDILAKYAVEIRRLGKRVTEDVVAIGRNLAEAQKHVGHGRWLAWLMVEFNWSDQTARRYVHVYELSRDAKFNKLLNSGVPLSALYQLAAPKTSDGARAEIAERTAAGEMITADDIKKAIAHHKTAGSARADGSAGGAATGGDTQNGAAEDESGTDRLVSGRGTADADNQQAEGDAGDDHNGDDADNQQAEADASDDQQAEADVSDAVENKSPQLRDRWPDAERQERRELFEVVELDELLDALSKKLRHDLEQRLRLLRGLRRSPKLTKLVKTALETRSSAKQITALVNHFQKVLGDDDFEVCVRTATN